VRLRPAEWQLALPLVLAYAAFFLVPLLLLIVVSGFADEKITTPGLAQWRKFLGDGFTWKVIFDTVKLGASRWRTLFRVTLPLSLPGLVAGCMLVFASSTTAFISQFVIGGNRLVYLPLLIWQQSLVVYNWPLASAAALTLLISVGLGVTAIAVLGRRSRAYAV
jgi:ABC-type spermidine/putrescine transport system permease subunit I